MKKILEKSGNFVRGKKWEPWDVVLLDNCLTEKSITSHTHIHKGIFSCASAKAEHN